jgi:hypothetical protein
LGGSWPEVYLPLKKDLHTLKTDKTYKFSTANTLKGEKGRKSVIFSRENKIFYFSFVFVMH